MVRRITLMLHDPLTVSVQADIMFLFNEGHLVDFEREELSNLVRALFADSPLREKNLAIIAGLARP